MEHSFCAQACGIDFGTSNSTVGWQNPNSGILIPLEEDEFTLPSVVFFNYEEDVIRFGRQAIADYLDDSEGRLMRSLKSLLGSNLLDGQTEIQGKSLPFRHLLTVFIGELKRRADQHAGQNFEHAVLGRPVFFVDDNAAADRLAQTTLEDIALSIGFKDVSFQYEPIAAALDYESRIHAEERVLIADIGGGTSDFSLIRLSPERRHLSDRREDILATGGVHIGGTDFDRQLSLAQAMPLLGYKTRLKNQAEMPSSYYFNLATWHTINQVYTQKIWLQLKDVYRDVCERDKFERLLNLVEQRAGHWLAIKVEEAKIALSDTPQVELHLERLALEQALTIKRADFDASIARMVTGVEATVAGVLRDAGVAADAVDTVFFTGGSSGVQSLRDRIGALLPAARRVEGDLFGSIGAGLALDAVRKFG